MSRVTLIALLAAWLALGIGGKVARYAPEQEAAGPRAERLVREFLGAYGWSLADRQKMTRAGLYTAQVFVKAGCDNRMAVAALGAADEAADVAVDQLGQDVAFLEDGQFSARPSAGAFLPAPREPGSRSTRIAFCPRSLSPPLRQGQKRLARRRRQAPGRILDAQAKSSPSALAHSGCRGSALGIDCRHATLWRPGRPRDAGGGSAMAPSTARL